MQRGLRAMLSWVLNFKSILCILAGAEALWYLLVYGLQVGMYGKHQGQRVCLRAAESTGLVIKRSQQRAHTAMVSLRKNMSHSVTTADTVLIECNSV